MLGLLIRYVLVVFFVLIVVGVVGVGFSSGCESSERIETGRCTALVVSAVGLLVAVVCGLVIGRRGGEPASVDDSRLATAH